MTTRVDGIQIEDGDITEAKLQTLINPVAQVNNNAFNIGVLGFKLAVNDGLTVFNLVDGIVDEFHDNTGVDTPENSNATYDSTSDFYANTTPNQPLPSPSIQRQSFISPGAGTYSVEPTTTAVDVLVIGGAGGGGAGGYNHTSGGGGGAGGLVFYENYPVTPGSTIPLSVGEGGEGGGGVTAGVDVSPPQYQAAIAINPERSFTFYNPAEGPSTGHTFYYSPGQQGADSVFNASPAVVITAEGGGAGGGYSHTSYVGAFEHAFLQGGSAGGTGTYNTEDNNESGNAEHSPTQTSNHPVPGLSNDPLPGTPINARGSFGSAGGVSSGVAGPTTNNNSGGGGGAGGPGGDGVSSPQTGGAGGVGLNYNVADGSTPVGYSGGGGGSGSELGVSNPPNAGVPFGAGVGQNETSNASTPFLGGIPLGPISSAFSTGESFPGTDGTANRGGGGGGGMSMPSPAGVGLGGIGGSGIIVVAESKGDVNNSSMTLISDTFTANSTPSSARLVIFAELGDTINSEISASVTRDNSTFNAVTLTDEGYQTGEAGIKIFTGSTPLTGSGSPQVQLRWKIVGSSLEDTNKIHGVSLQWK
tara:strand:- start:8 stop:1765 length:1758 start_codon:yes stop_codon:yes gene_type:complete